MKQQLTTAPEQFQKKKKKNDTHPLSPQPPSQTVTSTSYLQNFRSLNQLQ